MNIHKLRMDTSGNVEDISFVLAKKNGDKLGNITNVDNIVTKHSMKEASEFTFTAHKKMGDNIIKFWNDIKDFKLIWIPEWDMWYEIYVEVNEEDENIKNVSGTSLGEAELSQIMLYGIEINTETDIAREEYKIPTTFYNPDHPEASLMDRLLTDKAPHYKIKHIDKSLMNLQRTFTFDDTSIYDALQEVSEELDCLFIFGCGSDENGKPERTISVYDLEANCVDCGNRDTFVHKCPKCGSTNIILGYGEYTNVFISRDNLADEITYSVDTDSVKNCMKLEAGDDLMTAAIRSCNPNGTDYIYYFPDETREEMSTALQEKLKSYDALYEKYQSDYNFTINDSFVTNYNALVNKYKTYEENLKDTEIKNPIVGYPKLMRIYFDTIDMVQLLRNKLMPPVDKPDNNAKSQGEYLMANLPSSASTTSLKNLSVSTADNIMVMLAQSIVKGVFKVTVTNTTLSNNVWKGKFNLENYADKDDKFTSQFVSISINENYESYVKQRIDSILARSDENYYDIVGLFKQDMTVFKSQLKKYCLNTLQIFQKCCQSCIDMMVQQGISSNSTSSIYGINTKVLYENVYIPYYNKMNAIQDEIKVREDELYTVEGKYNNQNQLVQDGIQIEIERIITEVQDALNFKNYIGVDLYKEFSSFIRMDKYSNDNYISDGLNNTDLMKNAIEFITVATKELFKSATLQHSITGTIKNFLRMKEFEPVTNNFKNGNWICVGIDDKVYQLRIIEYEIDFSDTQNISVTFSDVVSTPDGMTDLESILSNSSKIATSYNGVVRQSTINTNFKNKMNEMITKGLSMTNTKIVSNADNQDITWDEHGLLCREYDDIISDYTDSQLKIINHGIYITDDNWKTARAGIGNFIYYDPKDKTYKESYGVIADTLVGNLILSSEVGIYNEEKSIEMDKNGIVVTTNTYNKNVFTIQKELKDPDGNISYQRQLYIDDNGNIVLGGGASISWDNVTGTDHVVTDVDAEKLKNDITAIFNQKINILEQQTDKKAETWYQADDPKVQWTTPEEKEKHSGDLWYNTATNETFIYNGTDWGAMTGEIPQELWDTIDGKAQIFTTIPVPPYHVGDLWFGGVDKDIMTCVSTRLSGEYVDTDWERLNKYTDDSSVENVKHNLGYTYIDGKYVISPHIVGGDLTIGNVNGTYAKIDSNGILTAKGANISGTIYATDGEFSGKVVAKSGSFHGSVYATDGVFNGTVYATDGKFSGDIDASTITAFKKYTLYNGNSTSDIAYFDGKALNLGLLYTAESSPMDQGQSVGFQMTKNNRIIDVYGDMNFYQGNINTPGEIEAKMITAKNIYEMGLDGNLYTFIRSGETGNYQEIKYNNNTSFLFDHQGYGHTHTIIANSGGTKAIAIGDGVNAPVAGDEEWCILPYNITATKDSYSGQSEIATIGRDRSGTMNIGYDGYRFNCLYIKSINLNGDERSAWPSGGSSGTSNYNNLTNKPSINGNVLTGNNTSDDLGLASKSHSHSNYLTSSSLSGYATTSQLGNYYTKSETYTKSEVNNLVQNSGGSSSAPSLVTVSDGGVRPPISTGTGATQKVAYITANDTKKLTVKAQFGSTGYTNMNVALATSDQRLKCNIKESQISGLDAINAIKLREFDWVQTGKHQEIGVIADELEIIDKNLTFGGGYDEYGDMNIKGVDSFYLQGYEIKAIQELSQINEIQEKEVQELKNMILQLQGEISILKQKLEELV